MAKKKATPAPQQAPSVEESATRHLKQANSKLMEVQAEINKEDAILTHAIIENRLKRFKVQKDLIVSLYLEVFVNTRLLDVIYRNLDKELGPEAALIIIEAKDKLNLVVDQLSYCAKFISETVEFVGCDEGKIFNSSKSTEDKQ